MPFNSIAETLAVSLKAALIISDQSRIVGWRDSYTESVVFVYP